MSFALFCVFATCPCSRRRRLALVFSFRLMSWDSGGRTWRRILWRWDPRALPDGLPLRRWWWTLWCRQFQPDRYGACWKRGRIDESHRALHRDCFEGNRRVHRVIRPGHPSRRHHRGRPFPSCSSRSPDVFATVYASPTIASVDSSALGSSPPILLPVRPRCALRAIVRPVDAPPSRRVVIPRRRFHRGSTRRHRDYLRCRRSWFPSFLTGRDIHRRCSDVVVVASLPSLHRRLLGRSRFGGVFETAVETVFGVEFFS
mmetsp:Transcript_38384/g.70790  ORF Transcript_38384/g.70790 Transcript_38384/m.70790 type:complete len:258 (+) Transcript_38384:1272-2045(+)